MSSVLFRVSFLPCGSLLVSISIETLSNRFPTFRSVTFSQGISIVSPIRDASGPWQGVAQLPYVPFSCSLSRYMQAIYVGYVLRDRALLNALHMLMSSLFVCYECRYTMTMTFNAKDSRGCRRTCYYLFGHTQHT